MKNRLRNSILTVVCLLLSVLSLSAQEIDTLAVFSPSMGRSIKTLVILPSQYSAKSSRSFPVLYLLHGYGGSWNSWMQIKPDLPQAISRYGIIVVCPDGENSWYWDSPLNSKMKFETFVSDELVRYIDKNYRTKPSADSRAITGLSMGGHGGLWLGIRHQDVFGACGSMSGGVDIRPFPNNWEMKKQLGEYAQNKQVWDEHTVINQLAKIQSGKLQIIFDCGTSDFFCQVNRNLHQKLLEMKIPHDYIERPGAHNAAYWNNSIDYQLVFFAKFFGCMR